MNPLDAIKEAVYGTPVEPGEWEYHGPTLDWEIECPECGERLAWTFAPEEPDAFHLSVECSQCGFTDAIHWVPGTFNKGANQHETMTENERSDTERTRDNDGYTVQCEECGDVDFDVLEENWFGNERIALYYAGYHDGKEHSGSAVQLSSPKQL